MTAPCPTCNEMVKESGMTVYKCPKDKTIFTVMVTRRMFKGKQPTETEVWGTAKDYLDASKYKMSGARSLVPKMRKIVD